MPDESSRNLIINHKFRSYVRPQIDKYRLKHNDPKTCPLCQKQYSEDEYVVDHKILFHSILDSFLKDNSINIRDINLNDHEEIKQDWIGYHSRHAKLRLICHSCNEHR